MLVAYQTNKKLYCVHCAKDIKFGTDYEPMFLSEVGDKKCCLCHKVIAVKALEKEVKEADAPIVKKGRGRPRKTPVVAVAEDIPVIKRGRGRPRKNA